MNIKEKCWTCSKEVEYDPDDKPEVIFCCEKCKQLYLSKIIDVIGHSKKAAIHSRFEILDL